MRVALLSVGSVARAAGFAAVAAIAVAALLHVARHDHESASKNAFSAGTADPITAELRRCQSLGMAAQDDRSCIAAWAENRRRFFGSELPAGERARAADGSPAQQPER